MKVLEIYIPIWLDLLFWMDKFGNIFHTHLHSNMVRFIIYTVRFTTRKINEFTFQYG